MKIEKEISTIGEVIDLWDIIKASKKTGLARGYLGMYALGAGFSSSVWDSRWYLAGKKTNDIIANMRAAA